MPYGFVFEELPLGSLIKPKKINRWFRTVLSANLVAMRILTIVSRRNQKYIRIVAQKTVLGSLSIQS